MPVIRRAPNMLLSNAPRRFAPAHREQIVTVPSQGLSWSPIPDGTP